MVEVVKLTRQNAQPNENDEKAPEIAEIVNVDPNNTTINLPFSDSVHTGIGTRTTMG